MSVGRVVVLSIRQGTRESNTDQIIDYRSAQSAGLVGSERDGLTAAAAAEPSGIILV